MTRTSSHDPLLGSAGVEIARRLAEVASTGGEPATSGNTAGRARETATEYVASTGNYLRIRVRGTDTKIDR